MSRTFGGTYELVWNGIDVARYQQAEPWPTDRPTVLFVGRHEPRKGLAVLIDAFCPPPRRRPALGRLRGTETAACARRPATTTGSSGSASSAKREKIRRIRGADVLCAPSLHGESFGVILLEGMAAGTPVVASDLVGYRNVARPDVDALLTAPGDPVALAAALEVALAGGPVMDAWWPAPSSGRPASRSRAWPRGISTSMAEAQRVH